MSGNEWEALREERTVLLKTFGGHSFGYIAPTVWNKLPADLRASPSLQTFQAKLNFHIIFCQAF